MKLHLALLAIALSPVLYAQQYTNGNITITPSSNGNQYLVGVQSLDKTTIAFDVTVVYTVNGSSSVQTKHSRFQRLFFPEFALDQYFTPQIFTIIPLGEAGTFKVETVSVEEIHSPSLFSFPG